jgi:uncharacterized protein YbbC (DUF1343 family)
VSVSRSQTTITIDFHKAFGGDRARLLFFRLCIHLSMKVLKNLILLLAIMAFMSCSSQSPAAIASDEILLTGAQRMYAYLSSLKGKKVAVVANPTSVVGRRHLVDTLLSHSIHIVKVFAPEHGFRGEAGAGETIKDGKDAATNLPVISLYGKTKKPTPEMLKDVDVVVFDIQDVGTRFYTYISTMHYVMQACAENNKPLVVLDRPNPNGDYIDGPVRKPGLQSFVGMHPIPIVHGCTVGELAKMINGEGWLDKGMQCTLEVVTCTGYTHASRWEPSVPPSPNLRTYHSIRWYPSLCYFEGTVVSVGRGTNQPFECLGFPGLVGGTFEFMPRSVKGVVSQPPHEGKLCKGWDLRSSETPDSIDLSWLWKAYEGCPDKNSFFNAPDFFDKLSGDTSLRESVIAGKSIGEVRRGWLEGIEAYKRVRQRYLLYP